ncbi:MAG: hypothetical protein EA382_00225 [Spirochaetaceae bacterium]|nr:MAG: hypothetical protein EA382_00225 [Spirochaetaceae bacterium]
MCNDGAKKDPHLRCAIEWCEPHSEGAPMNRPNILFLLSDEHSYRFLGARAGSPEGESVLTPTLDSLIARGTHFTDAYCQMPLCTPSRISLLTGLEPRACGAWMNESVLRPELPTVASLLGDAGYRTALIGKMHLGGSAQFAGFQSRPYGDLTGKTGHQWEPIEDDDRHTMRVRTAKAGITGIPESLLQEQVVAQETVSWVREQEAIDPGSPWFACASFSRPHFPLTAPRRWIDHYRRTGITEPKVAPGGDAYDHPMSVGMRKGFHADAIDHEEMMNARLGYFACVSYLDEIIGDLLQRLERSGSLDNTVIVYTTDHGEMAGEHGVWWKNGWYDACTRVPLIVSTPDQRRADVAANSCATPVGLVDLLPTLCGFARVEVPANATGRDLGPAISGGALDEVPVTCDVLYPRWGAGTEFRMVRCGDYKYVRFRDAPPLAFDLRRDPGEQVNLLAHGDLAPDVRAAIDALKRHAEQSIDFDAVDSERTERDGDLDRVYQSSLPSATGNLYVYPSGELVNADDAMLYDRSVVAKSAEAVMTRTPL